jgi:hypothetical protein
MLRLLLTKAIANRVAGHMAGKLPVPRPVVTWRQKGGALLVAAAIDFIQILLFPVFALGFLGGFEIALDVVAAAALLLICGRRWQFALAFVLELLPGMALFPTWTAFVLGLGVRKPDAVLQKPAAGAGITGPVTSRVVRAGQ